MGKLLRLGLAAAWLCGTGDPTPMIAEASDIT